MLSSLRLSSEPLLQRLLGFNETPKDFLFEPDLRIGPFEEGVDEKIEIQNCW